MSKRSSQELGKQSKKSKRTLDVIGSKLAVSVCKGCGVVENSKEDQQMSVGWIRCEGYHEPFAETYVLYDDDYFSCKDCL